MSNVTKFRAWIDGEMIYIKDDLLISFYNFPSCVNWSIYNRFSDICIYKHDSTYKDEYEKNKLMQFSGKQDKDGKDLYAGDIILEKLEDKNTDTGYSNWYAEVKQVKGCWCLCQLGFDYKDEIPTLLFDDDEPMELVGNIYNPPKIEE